MPQRKQQLRAPHQPGRLAAKRADAPWGLVAAWMYPDLLTDHDAGNHTGAIIGLVFISEQRRPDQCSGHYWAFGPICNVISRAVRFQRPIPARGKQGPWQLPPGVRGHLLDQLRGSEAVAFDVESQLGPQPP